MKIHIHSPSYFPQLVGMTYASIGHAEVLTELGHDVTILVAGHALSQPVPDSARPWKAIGSGLAGNGMPWDRVRGDTSELVRFTADDQPDLIIVEGWYTPAAALIASFARIGTPVVMASHGAADIDLDALSISSIVRSNAYKLAERFWIPRLARHLSGVLILSDYEDRARFADVALYRKLALPTFACPNFSIYQSAEHARQPSDNPVLLHIGEMQPHKNQMLGLEVLSRLPPKYRLQFVYPADTDYGRLLKKRAVELGLSSRITYLTGRRRHELEHDVASADCLLILTPSKDVQPIVAVDAMTKAVPFVSTRVGCMPQLEGGLVASADPVSMAGAVEALFSGQNYQAFSQSALDYALKMLSKEKSQTGLAAMIKLLGI